MQSKVEIILSISFFPLMTECLLLGHFLPRGNGIQQFWMLQISYSTVIPEQPTPSWKCGHTLISLPEVRFWFRSAKEALLKEVNITELKQWRRHTELLRLEPWALGTEDSTLWLSDDPWWDNSDPVDLQIPSGRNSLGLCHPPWKDFLQCLYVSLAYCPQTWQRWGALKQVLGSTVQLLANIFSYSSQH